jgi:hypothetical protein
MAGTVEFAQGVAIRKDEITGRDFSVPLIRWTGYTYAVQNLNLPDNWQSAIPKLSAINPQKWGNSLDFLCTIDNFDWGLQVHENTGLITKVSIDTGERRTCVRLNTSHNSQNGTYTAITESINCMSDDISVAFIYLKFFSDYLGFICGNDERYPYIEHTQGGYFSPNLILPPEVVIPTESTPHEMCLRHDFDKTACNIAGQFGQQEPRVDFDKNGLLINIQLPYGEGLYYLNRKSPRQYVADSVRFPLPAAALHGIAATFINELIEARKPE